jgi:hypothetical protein
MFKKYLTWGLKLPVSFAMLLPLLCVVGCATTPPLSPVNLAEPGWKTRQGEAVWRSKKDAPEITGELLVATHPDGRSLVQFTKTPIPFIIAQTTSNAWQIHIVPSNQTHTGRGKPPVQILWLYLPRCLDGMPPPKFLAWHALPNDGWRLENHLTGESLEGYLNP